MTKKRRALLGVLAVIAAGCIVFLIYTVNWKFFTETEAYGITGKLGEVSEQSLKEQLAPELAALDAAGLRYQLRYDVSDSDGRGEAVLWIVVPAYHAEKVLNTISLALDGIPDVKIEGWAPERERGQSSK